MKREKLVEWYGRRFSATSRITAFFLIIAFGILIAFNERDEKSPEHNAESEQSVRE